MGHIQAFRQSNQSPHHLSVLRDAAHLQLNHTCFGSEFLSKTLSISSRQNMNHYVSFFRKFGLTLCSLSFVKLLPSLRSLARRAFQRLLEVAQGHFFLEREVFQ